MKDIKPGDLVQIWDWQSSKPLTERLTFHGKLGYVIKDQTQGPAKGVIWEVILFEDEVPVRQMINTDWLIKINKSSDIKKKT